MTTKFRLIAAAALALWAAPAYADDSTDPAAPSQILSAYYLRLGLWSASDADRCEFYLRIGPPGASVDNETAMLVLPHAGAVNDTIPVPSTGVVGAWNDVRFEHPSPLTTGLPDAGCAFYHVHSLAARPEDRDDVIATTEYGERFATIVGHGNVFGVQFHPEKSSRDGLALLANFVALSRGGRGVGIGTAWATE